MRFLFPLYTMLIAGLVASTGSSTIFGSPNTTKGGKTTNALQPEPQVNEAEILRMGNMVQHIDGLRRTTAEDAYVAAMGPPESDAEEWFISVISMRGCAACQRHERDWRTSRWLLGLSI